MSHTPRPALRARDALLVVPSVVVALGLLALYVANVNSAPVSSVLTPSGLVHAVTATATGSTNN